jgi:hypothetical protein
MIASARLVLNTTLKGDTNGGELFSYIRGVSDYWLPENLRIVHGRELISAGQLLFPEQPAIATESTVLFDFALPAIQLKLEPVNDQIGKKCERAESR